MTDSVEAAAAAAASEEPMQQQHQHQHQPQPEAPPQQQQPQPTAPETALALKSLTAAGAALAFAPGGDQIWVCSPDADILALDAASGEVAHRRSMDGHPVCLAVSHAGKQLAVGKADGKVELNDLPDVDFDDFLVRATSPIRDVCFSASDKWAAVVSDDLEVLLVEVAAREVTQLKGAHEGAGRSVCFDPKEEFLVSLGADGQACVWDLATKACVWSKRVLERGASADPHLVVARAAWRPDGGVLALPGSRQPLLVERGSWRALPSAPAAALAHANDTSVLAWSPDGKVLASAGLDKRVLLWAAAALAQGGALQATQVYTGPAGDDAGPGLGLCVRNLAWTKDRALALLAADGSFALQAVPAAAAVATTATAAAAVATTATAAAAPEADGKKALGAQEEEKEKAGAEGASDEESTASKKKQKQKKKGKDGAASLLDDEASVGTKEEGEGKGEEEEDGGATQEEHPPEEEDEEDEMMEEASLSSSKAGRMVEVPDMQGPFLPSSSPLDAAKRFLVWSPMGSIVSQNLGDHHAIEVEFADASRRPVRFTDHYGFMMGSMAEDGAIFASVALGADEAAGAGAEDEERSTVFFRPFSNYSQKNQWLYTLPEGESALCVAVGARWAAVATTRQWVRLFTFSGLQDGILALPGPVVTMVGRGDLLAVFYHGGSPLVTAAGASQCLHYQLLDVRRSAVVASGPLPLSPRALLQWCGVSNAGILHAVDSEGVLYGLIKGFGWHWTPLLETARLKRNKLDAFWPVGVHGNSFMCTLLKGGDEHPATNPKPLVTSLPFKLPLVAVPGGDGQGLLRLEETRLLSRAFLNQKAHQQEALASEGLEEPALEEELLRDQAALDTQLIKMLQMAAATENGERMLEVAEQLHLQKSLELAIRVADHYSLPQVAGRISDLLAARFPPTYEDEMEDLGAASAAYAPSPQPARRAGLLGKAMGRSGGGSARAPAMEEDDDAAAAVADDDADAGSLADGGAPDESSQQSPAAAAPSLSKLRGGEGGGSKAGSSAPAAARNPFAVKKDQAGAKGGEKRPRGIAESLGSFLGSPSPKKPVLQKTSSFARSASEIRSKKKHDRRV